MRQSTPMRPTDRPLVNDQKMTDSNEGNVLVVHTTTITVREGGREGEDSGRKSIPCPRDFFQISRGTRGWILT